MTYFWMGLIGVLVGALGMDIMKYRETKNLRELLHETEIYVHSLEEHLDTYKSIEKCLYNRIDLLKKEVELLKKLP